MGEWQDSKRKAFSKLFDYESIERDIMERVGQGAEVGEDPYRIAGASTGRFKISSPNPQMWTQPNPFPQYSMAAVPIFQGCPCPLCQTASDIDTPLHPGAREFMVTRALREEDKRQETARLDREAYLNNEAKLWQERQEWIDW